MTTLLTLVDVDFTLKGALVIHTFEVYIYHTINIYEYLKCQLLNI
jgi:hypothetical protein